MPKALTSTLLESLTVAEIEDAIETEAQAALSLEQAASNAFSDHNADDFRQRAAAHRARAGILGDRLDFLLALEDGVPLAVLQGRKIYPL